MVDPSILVLKKIFSDNSKADIHADFVVSEAMKGYFTFALTVNDGGKYKSIVYSCISISFLNTYFVSSQHIAVRFL